MRAIRSCLRAALLAVAAVLAASPASAQTVEDLRTSLDQVRDQILDAAGKLTPLDSAAAISSLELAAAHVGGVRDLLADPAIAAALGKTLGAVEKGVDGVEKKLLMAEIVVKDPGAILPKKVARLRAAALAVSKTRLKLGKPMIEEVNAKTAGFHKPGEVVKFRLYAPDGSVCTSAPIVTVENGGLTQAIDLNSVYQDPVTGEVSITMGPEQGGGSITVSACDRTSTRLVYNYGATGLPKNLPGGNYSLYATYSGEYNAGPVFLGTIPLMNGKMFQQMLVSAFQQAMTQYTQPGCNQGVSYSAFNGSSFSVTYFATCTDGEHTATQRVTFTITRL